jgi:hypothetical protein
MKSEIKRRLEALEKHKKRFEEFLIRQQEACKHEIVFFNDTGGCITRICKDCGLEENVPPYSQYRFKALKDKEDRYLVGLKGDKIFFQRIPGSKIKEL